VLNASTKSQLPVHWVFLAIKPTKTFYAVTFQETPGNFREFKLYTDVTSRQLQYAFQQSSARDKEDTYNFPAVGMGLSCSWKRLFAIGSTTEVK